MSRYLLLGGLVAEGFLGAAFLMEQTGPMQLLSGTVLSSLGALPEAYALATAWFASSGETAESIAELFDA